MDPVWLIAVFVFAAAAVSASTGFGFSIVAAPFLVILMGPKSGIQVNLILSFVLSLVMLPLIWKDIQQAIIKVMVPAAIVGGPVGGLFLAGAADWMLHGVIGAVLLFVAVTTLKELVIQPSVAKGISAGAASGAMTTALGMPGPPVLAYLASLGAGARTTRATALSFFAIVYAIAITTQLAFGQFRGETILTALIYLPAMIVGVIVGNRVIRYLDEQTFNRMIAAILAVSAAGMLVKAAAPAINA